MKEIWTHLGHVRVDTTSRWRTFANPPDFFALSFSFNVSIRINFSNADFPYTHPNKKPVYLRYPMQKVDLIPIFVLGESILVICTKQRLWPTVSFCRNGKKRFHNMARMTAMHRYKFIDMRGIFPFWISAKSPNAKKIYRKFYNNVCSNGFNVI